MIARSEVTSLSEGAGPRSTHVGFGARLLDQRIALSKKLLPTNASP